jgi:DnaK suppressor protein
MSIDLKKMKERLEAKRQELETSIHALPQGHAELNDPANSKDENDFEYTYQDTEDDAVDAQEMAQEQSIVSTEQSLLDQVNAALTRIEDGTYGYCTVDGALIPEKRLEAIPWAALCIKDQEALDQRANLEREVISNDNDGTRFS